MTPTAPSLDPKALPVPGRVLPRVLRPSRSAWLFTLPLALAIGALSGGASALRDLSASRSSLVAMAKGTDRQVEAVALAESLAETDARVPGNWAIYATAGTGAVIAKGEVSNRVADLSPRGMGAASVRVNRAGDERATPYAVLALDRWDCRRLAATLAAGPSAGRIQVARWSRTVSETPWAAVGDRPAVDTACSGNGEESTAFRIRP